MYESEIEQIALDILRDKNGYTVLFVPDISESEQKEREYTDVVLQNRLRDAINRINPSIPADAREEAFKKAMRTVSVNLLDNNEAFHRKGLPTALISSSVSARVKQRAIRSG